MTEIPVSLGRRPRTFDGPAAATAAPTARAPFHVLAKPSGPICNLDCEYCFFLSKEALYPGDRFRMADDVLDAYLRDLFEAHPDGEVTVAWQGGEPTLMGVDFFRRVVERAEAHRRPGQQLQHTIQTNGTLLTDEWCELLARAQASSSASASTARPSCTTAIASTSTASRVRPRCCRGLDRLKAHGVDTNILCTVQRGEPGSPARRSTATSATSSELRHFQFIPIVELDNETGFQEGNEVTDRSVDPDAWGTFLIDDLRRVGACATSATVFVQMFDAALGVVVRASRVDVHLP